MGRRGAPAVTLALAERAELPQGPSRGCPLPVPRPATALFTPLASADPLRGRPAPTALHPGAEAASLRLWQDGERPLCCTWV